MTREEFLVEMLIDKITLKSRIHLNNAKNFFEYQTMINEILLLEEQIKIIKEEIIFTMLGGRKEWKK